MTERRIAEQLIQVRLADGRDLDLMVGNPDMVRWDLTRSKHGWPTMEEAPMLWATFVAWRAAVRTKVTESTWEKWSEHEALSVVIVTDEEGQPVGEPVDPTQQGVTGA